MQILSGGLSKSLRLFPKSSFALVIVLLLTSQVPAQTERTIRHLGQPFPAGDLIFDKDNNLYGTTTGVNRNYGTVFELRRYQNGVYGYRYLHKFTNGVDGAYPQSRLIFDAQGNLYGAAAGGGTNFCPLDQFVSTCGAIFELTPTPAGEWVEQVLYSFQGGSDGSNPSSGVISDEAGNLYGMTGGIQGTIFKLTRSSDGTWAKEVLYRFTDGLDGEFPTGGLVRDTAGALYGVARIGGAAHQGTIFQLSPAPDGAWSFRTLYSFCSQPNCSDGADPIDRPTLDVHGNLYGTTLGGGVTPCLQFIAEGCGTIFKLAHERDGSWSYHRIHVFCAKTCAEGARPAGSLVLDKSGALYGVTITGGLTNQGTVFKIHQVPGNWVFDSLYSFCSQLPLACTDGADPEGGLALDSAGNLFGTTLGLENVFEITP